MQVHGVQSMDVVFMWCWWYVSMHVVYHTVKITSSDVEITTNGVSTLLQGWVTLSAFMTIYLDKPAVDTILETSTSQHWW